MLQKPSVTHRQIAGRGMLVDNELESRQLVYASFPALLAVFDSKERFAAYARCNMNHPGIFE